MIKRLMVAVPVAIALALSACAPFVSTSGEGAIQIFFGTPTGSRALSDPPFSPLPVFSGIMIKVSGPGMDPVEFTVDAAQTSFTAMVPGGSDRVVELYAPVDWDATVTLLPDFELFMPKLVKAYGATTTIDVVPGQSVTAVLRLEVAETKILLPDAINSYILRIGDSLHSPDEPVLTSVPVSYSSDFEFDRFGRLFFSNSSSVRLSVNPTLANTIPLVGAASGDDLAFDRSRNRLYLYYDSDGSSLSYFDISTDVGANYDVTSPDGYDINHASGSVAIDAAGYVYVPIYQNATAYTGLAKLSISAPSGSSASSQLLIFSSLSALGLDSPLEIRDMTVKDGRLYVLAGENHGYYDIVNSPNHGKLVEIDLNSLTKLRELGYALGDPTDSNNQFYGPQRFIAIAPRKLIIADDGYIGSSDTDLDRIVAVDLEAWRISEIVATSVSFFNRYQC